MCWRHGRGVDIRVPQSRLQPRSVNEFFCKLRSISWCAILQKSHGSQLQPVNTRILELSLCREQGQGFCHCRSIVRCLVCVLQKDIHAQILLLTCIS